MLRFACFPLCMQYTKHPYECAASRHTAGKAKQNCPPRFCVRFKLSPPNYSVALVNVGFLIWDGSSFLKQVQMQQTKTRY